MIMPVSAAQSYATPSFKGVIRESDALNQVAKNFTKMEKTRWDNIKTVAENTNDNLVFQFILTAKKIGDTIIKIFEIHENKEKVVEEVYGISRRGSIYLYDKQALVRKLLDTMEGVYNK